MHNLRQFISQARSAGKTDDAKLLEQNLRDLQVHSTFDVERIVLHWFTDLKSRQKCPDLEWSGFQMVGTRAIAVCYETIMFG